jgi:hypothetical protein
MIRLNPSKGRKDTLFRSERDRTMLLPNEVYEHGVPHAQFEHWERRQRLSVVRERLGQISERIFELSCQLQRQFNVDDVREALMLVAESKTLKAYEATLTRR